MTTATPPAPGVSDLLGAAGGAPEIRWKNKVWRVGHPTQRAKAELERLVAQQAWAEVKDLATAVPEDFPALKAEFLRMVSAKEFKTWGAGWQAAVTGPNKTMLFTLSLVRCCHPDATEEDVRGLLAERGDEVSIALVEVTPDFFTHLSACHPDLTTDAERADLAAELTRRYRAGAGSPVPAEPTPSAMD